MLEVLAVLLELVLDLLVGNSIVLVAGLGVEAAHDDGGG